DLLQTGTGSGTIITLSKTRQFYGCTNDGLSGTFGVAASGVSSTAAATAGDPPVSTAFGLLGRFNADGQGNLLEDTVGAASPLVQRQVTGTYTVNADCTGTASLTGSDGKSRKINFVII